MQEHNDTHPSASDIILDMCYKLHIGDVKLHLIIVIGDENFHLIGFMPLDIDNVMNFLERLH